jgi:hypothetical protein
MQQSNMWRECKIVRTYKICTKKHVNVNDYTTENTEINTNCDEETDVLNDFAVTQTQTLAEPSQSFDMM